MITEDLTFLTAGSVLPAIATLTVGVAFLLPWRARSKHDRAPSPATFAAALSAAVEVEAELVPEDGHRIIGVDHPVNESYSTGDNPAGGRQRAGDEHFGHDTDRIGVGEIDVESELGIRAPRSRPERKVPLTRLPLRRQTATVAWPLLLEGRNPNCNRDARHRLLAELARAGDMPDEAVLIAAYREEDPAGRALALRALKFHTSSDVRAIFEEALRDGSDDERAAAVEALASCGPRECLVTALSDGVDAIAARAALGYVGSRERADYHLALTPFVDAARIDALLSLLAGYLE